MDNLITKIEKMPLTKDDVFAICDSGGEVKKRFELYDDLVKYKTLESAMENIDFLLVLLQLQSGEGHWVGLFRDAKDRNILHYFGSYGLDVDEALHAMHENHHLLRLIDSYPYDMIVNKTRYQAYGSAATCGRWIGLRVLFRHLSDEEFRLFIKNHSSGYKNDDIAVMVTLFLTKNINAVKLLDATETHHFLHHRKKHTNHSY